MSGKPQILVVGAGYVGLATAVFLAVKGYQVHAIDINPDVVKSLRQRRLHFREAELQRHLKRVIANGRMTVDLPDEAVYRSADIIFIAIDSADQVRFDMRFSQFKRIAGHIGSAPRKRNASVVLRSTNALGFSDTFRKMLDATPHGDRVRLLVCPEFLREGHAYEDTARPWRVVIGADARQAAQPLVKLVRSAYPSSLPLIVTDRRSAELIKLGSNVYLAHRLAFVHELADLARAHNLDFEPIRQGVGLDPRIGLEYFSAGLGFGGSCLPKDCTLINSDLDGIGFEMETALAATAVNERVLEHLVTRLKNRIGTLRGKKITLLGATFKPETDDLRGSRAVVLAHRLRRSGARVAVYEPMLAGSNTVDNGRLKLVPDLHVALRGSAVLIVGTAHRRFRALRPGEVARLMRRRLVCDYFGILNRKSWTRAGFEFV